jgi:hypothetical protein
MDQKLGAESNFKRNTPQLAATGIKGMCIQLSLGSAQLGSIFIQRRLTCSDACIGMLSCRLTSLAVS